MFRVRFHGVEIAIAVDRDSSSEERQTHSAYINPAKSSTATNAKITLEPPAAKISRLEADLTRLQIELAQEKTAHAATRQQLETLQGLHRAQAATIASQDGMIQHVIRRHPEEVQRMQTFGREAEEERLRLVEGAGVNGDGMDVGAGVERGRGRGPEILQVEGDGRGRGRGSGRKQSGGY
ncbi:hypothetical protein DDE82_007596 [Stemphylium lycopersici]|nr:hypothetical protein DDE82_007596 [Stemphylium lycopersici]